MKACRVCPSSIRLASGRRVWYSHIDDWCLVWKRGWRYRVKISFHPDREAYATLLWHQYMLFRLFCG